MDLNSASQPGSGGPLEHVSWEVQTAHARNKRLGRKENSAGQNLPKDWKRAMWHRKQNDVCGLEEGIE